MLHHLRVRTPLIIGIVLVLGGIFVSEYFDLYYRLMWFDKAMH